MADAIIVQMTPPPTKFAALIVAASYLFAAAALAVRVDDLYTAEVPLGAGEQPQDAFDAALASVLVKVTGRRAVTVDAERFPDTGRFVQQYRIGADRSVWVRFDEVALRRELDRMGEPVWGSERPTTLVWLIVDDGFGERRIVGATASEGDDPGLEAQIPGAAACRVRHRGPAGGDCRRARPAPGAAARRQRRTRGDRYARCLGRVLRIHPSDASLRYGPDAILVGRLRSASIDEPLVRWTLLVANERFDWESGVSGGPHDVADYFAARLSSSAGATTRIVLSVEAVDSLDAYGRLSNYLAQLDLVEALAVERVNGDRVVFSLNVRGDVDRLMRSIALSRVLLPVESPSASGAPIGARAQRLHYRLMADS